jgi:hypothetical protein
VPSAFLFLPGVFLGMALVPATLRWALLVHTSITKQEGDFLGTPRRRLLWFTPLVVLLHPVPYLLAGLLAASFLALTGRLSAGWSWLFAGLYSYAVFIGFVVLPKMLALRRKTRDSERKV